MSNRILSYRGLLADGGEDTILLSTKKGEVGYRIIKFEMFPYKPGQSSVENTIQIFKDPGLSSSATAVEVDFSNNRLLGAGTFHESHADSLISTYFTIFDKEIFNQDIYVTHTNTNGTDPVNYYLELEIVKLDESQAMVTTLKDIRNNS